MSTDNAVYTTHELCERYRCSACTIWRKRKYQGFPEGYRFGAEICYPAEEVHAWEREHLPHLHDHQDAREKVKLDKQWREIRRALEDPAPFKTLKPLKGRARGK